MVEIVKIEGLRELEKALNDLPKATQRNVLRRALKKVAEPIEKDAQQKAPYLTGRLKLSIVTGTQLTRRQKADARKDGPYFAEVHVGTASGHGIPQEFGTVDHPAQPFMRPAWEANKQGALDGIKKEIRAEIDKAQNRRASRLLKGK